MDAFLTCQISVQLLTGETVILQEGLEITIDISQGIAFDGEFSFDIMPFEYSLIC